ncbi:MAG: pirin family protein [Alphaproteobacteria bacterium]|nr:pirin family protein [Alphaproteobacteria bacterium]
MIQIRPSAERGFTIIGWLDSKHTFSFGSYDDPEHRGFGVLRVINEDKVSPNNGFGMHGHKDMEIITYVLEGALEHKDSLGNGSVIVPGEVQLMRAGTGIMHSELNPDKDKTVHLLQIWIIPDQAGLPPSYQQKDFRNKRKPGHLTLLVSPDGKDESLIIHQNANLYVLDLEEGQSFSHKMFENRQAWVQVAKGDVTINEQTLSQGDGAQIQGGVPLTFKASKSSEILVFDLPR